MRWMLSLSLLAMLSACGRHASEQVATAAGPQSSAESPRPSTDPAAPSEDPASPPDPLGEPDGAGYRELDWNGMLPPEELEALERGDVPEVDHRGNHAMPQSGSYHTVDAVLGRKVRLPGYVVPLDSDDAGRLREFLFVPYYGACIHVPPPPPNQIVHVRLDKPIDPPDMYTPFYLFGRLRAEPIHGDLAGSAYTMTEAGLRPYDGIAPV